MADLAVRADVVARWGSLTSEEETKVDARLVDASALVRLAVPDIDARIAAYPDGPLAQATKAAIVGAVIRILDNPEGARRVQETIGDRAYTLDYGDSAADGLYISADELLPLQPGGGGQGYALGTAIVGTRPGWAPTLPRRGGGWWPTA